MYDTLIMLKPGTQFTIDELYELVTAAVSSGSAAVEKGEGYVRVMSSGGYLDIVRSDADHVVVESDELAEQFGIPSRGCRERFEMSGDDPGMELFNDYLFIGEGLQATGRLVVFDTVQCKLLFEEPE